MTMIILVIIMERMENLMKISPSLKRENAVDLKRIMLVVMIERNNLIFMILAVFAVKEIIERRIV